MLPEHFFGKNIFSRGLKTQTQDTRSQAGSNKMGSLMINWLSWNKDLKLQPKTKSQEQKADTEKSEIRETEQGT